jgi:DNA-binding Lrp family transcriptional regulator
MDARTISNRELARQLGVSETAVRRAAKAAWRDGLKPDPLLTIS